MDEVDELVKKVGILNNEYEDRPRRASPQGVCIVNDPVIDEPSLILKMYTMLERGAIPFNRTKVDEYGDVIRNLVRERRIDPRSGLGFAILSSDQGEHTLNVARWDNIAPIILKNNIYTFARGATGKPLPVEQNLGEVGAFCMWELAIADHERRAWYRYLNSNRTPENKRLYLYDTIKGDLEKTFER